MRGKWGEGHYDAAARLSTAADGSNGITYASGFDTSPGGSCLPDVTCYTPQGTFYALAIGETASFTGLNLTHTYNSRLQPLEFKASSAGGNAIDVSYSFVDSSNHNSGHVYGITNNLDGTRSQTFSYDQLNRLTAAQTTSTWSTSPAHCWGESFTLDPWGNLQSIAATSNSAYTGCSLESGFSSSADGNNHLPIFGYDLSGNTTSDGFVTNYQWDAESQLKSAAGVTYTYDGDGRRVSKVGSKLYWYGSGGDILAETDASGNTTAEYVFFGGKRIAMIPASGTPIYYVEDMLGTSRVITTSSGIVCYDADFYPYGGERAYTNTCPQNYKFEGKERDTETGNDDFGARYYSNRFGRWISADWSAVPAPIPYANLSNPQTLNLYAMVADDPESFADLDGHAQYSAANSSCSYEQQNSCQQTQEQQAAGAQAAQPQAQKHHHHKPKPKPPNRRPGNKPARIVFNETSGLRPGGNNPQDLHDARVSIAHTLLNAAGMRHPPSTVGDTLTTSAARAIGRDPDAMAAWGDSQAAVAEAGASADNTSGAIHFFLDYEGASRPAWATEDRETANYGPFINVAGGGDVPQDASVTIRVYTAQPQY